MDRIYGTLPENYRDQSELKKAARGNNNGYSPMFNPGCWPENATVVASVFIDCPVVIGNVVRFFFEMKQLDDWLSSLNPGDLVSGEVLIWEAGEDFDIQAMMNSIVRI